MLSHETRPPGPPTRVIVLAGPTAVGKTGAALHLAGALGGEIVNGDSVAMVRGFDLGSAKPTPAERARVPHHLIDVADPRDDLHAARFVDLALPVLTDIAARGRVPLVVGGTGLYLRALMRGLDPLPPVPDAVRRQMRARLDREGLPALRADLERLDPAYAARIAAHDPQRTLRALEIIAATGQPFSSFQTAWRADAPAGRPGFAFALFVLTRARDELTTRIEARARAMWRAGLVDEVRGLLARGLDLDVKPMRSLGYRQVAQHLLGECDADEALARLCKGHRDYARRQMTWFRGEPGARFVDADDLAGLLDAARAFLAGGNSSPC